MAPAGRPRRRLNDAAAEAGIVLVALALMVAAAAGGYVVGRETAEDGGEGAADVVSSEGEGAAGEENETEGGADDAETGTSDTTQEDAGGDTGGESDTGGGGGDAAAGEAVFAEAGCANCHTLEAAGASGNVGPNLDETDLEQEQIAQVVAEGRGAMPSFEGQLSDEQIQAVAAYVAESKAR